MLPLPIVLSLLLSPAPQKSEHPVPLSPDFNPAKCVECHEDKTKGKVVHAAVEAGCLSCHFVRNSAKGTRVVRKNAKTQTLCANCHADKKFTPSNNPVHPPAAEDCLRCHQPHNSENKGLLIKSTSGDKKRNLCLECHDQGLNVPEKGSRHAALDMGCATCHVTHKSGEIGKQDAQYHLTKAAPALCLDCHNATDKGLIEAHSAQPLASSNCIQCHDPHQSKAPKLMRANLHNPFEGKMCNACHVPAKDGKVALTQADPRAVCVTCHDEAAKKMESAKVQHAGALGDCTACHDPHAGRYAKFIKPDPVSACESCHSNQAEAHKTKKVLHDPVFKQSCMVCHIPHGGEREHLLRADNETLCLACHAPEASAQKLADGLSETILGGSVRLPVGYVEKARRIEISRQGLGHPVFGHPVRGTDPRDNTKQFNCSTCHDAHAGGKFLIVGEAGTSRAVCKRCHEEQKR